MNNTIIYVKNHVVLDSYSSSKNFVGFCFSDSGWNDNNYIEILKNIVESLVGRVSLVSSLNIGTSLDQNTQYYSITPKGKKCRDLLIEYGIIKNRKDNKASDFFHFCDEVSLDIVKNLILYQTSIGGATGHAFFVDTEGGIILYPHDDCGLGFVFLGCEESRREKLKVLKEIESKYQNYMSFKFWY